jgi:hypothetical protein
METRDDVQESPPVTDGVSNPSMDEGTLFDNLVGRRQELANQRETLIPIPGYEDPQLLVQYKLVPGDELNKIGRKNNKVKDPYMRGLYNAMDVMIRSCSGIFVQNGTGDPEQLTADGDPVEGFTPAFASKMKIEDNGSARNVILGLFNNNDIAIGQHSFRLQRWMGDTSLSVDEDLLLSGM